MRPRLESNGVLVLSAKVFFMAGIVKFPSSRGGNDKGIDRNAIRSNGSVLVDFQAASIPLVKVARANTRPVRFQWPIIIFPNGRVATTAGHIDLENIRIFFLHPVAGHADKIGRDPAAAVIAHRMDGICVPNQNRAIAIPQTDRFYPRVDFAIGGVKNIARTAATRPGNFAFVVDYPSVAFNLIDLASTGAEMGNLLRRCERFFQSGGDSLDRLLMKDRIAVGPLHTLFVQHFLGSQIAYRRVVLMDRAEHDTFGSVPAASAKTSRQRQLESLFT